ncbi:hypothetical protein PCASD_20857 [Puccinia coronata f. sp. avenae]|uniref:Uncharacterized protein n=1 Tax=Puccinia coronata f. sp. avenae TaxID=200324 RepID=A0A2N5U560_9BASI|nr:hypothetical protein PCASD_20857 [Puccinia coronata f. sp. avenae]
MNPATGGLSSNHAPPSGANASVPPRTQVPPSASLAAHSWIAELMEGMIPEMAQASNASASAMDPNNTGGDRADLLVPDALPEQARLTAEFALHQARGARARTDETNGRKREERRVRGMAQKSTLVEHYNKYVRGIQHFIKFFLGGPVNPQDYPRSPTPEELKALHWVDQRSQAIMAQLNCLRTALTEKTVAEQDLFVSQAEKEIRQKIPLPPFHPAQKISDLGGGQPITLQVQGDVERELAMAGISRFTFEWEVAKDQESAWNSTVVQVIGKKAVDWLRRAMKITNDESAQAPAIINHWLQSKSRELRQFQGMRLDQYTKVKSKKATKAQYQ